MESFNEGIEANDLASLLYRFEEAVTPPSTPTPTSAPNSQAVKVSQGPVTVVSSSLTQSSMAAQVQAKPKAIYPSRKPGISLLPFTLSQNSRVESKPLQLSNMATLKSVSPVQPQAAGSRANLIPRTAFTLIPSSQGAASLLLVKPVMQTNITKPVAKKASVIPSSKSIKRSASATILSSTANNAICSASSSLLQTMLLDKNIRIMPKKSVVKKPGEKASISKMVSTGRGEVISTTSTVSAFPSLIELNSNNLEGLASCSNIPSGLSQSLPSSPTSSKLFAVNREDDHDYCCNDGSLRNNTPNKNSKNVDVPGVDSSDGKEPSVLKEDSEKSAVSAEESRTISSLDAELFQDLEYLDNHISPTSPKVKEGTDDNVLEDGEVMVDEYGNDTFPLLTRSMPSLHPNKTDTNAQASDCQNDLFHQQETNSTVTFSFDGEEPGTGKKRGRRYRRRTELNTSPIREDKTDFFDKIPAFYTALSIPKKPTKTSVFASASKSLGSTDHLAPDNKITEHFDSGLYDKVPAHRRCFTNTAKEVDLNKVDPFEQQSSASASLNPLTSSLLSSSSTELNPESGTPPRRGRSRSRRKTRKRYLCSQSSSPGKNSRSRSSSNSKSHSPSHHSSHRLKSRSPSHHSSHRLKSRSPSHHSSHSLKSRSRSRHSSLRLNSRSRSRSNTSSRSCSTCSSYSNGSSCGSSCSGCSRSRSRSCSTCSSSDSSRSRSRSPQRKRDWQQRGNRAGSSSGWRNHHHRDRNRRHSRSLSPAHRAGWRSRSRSQKRHGHSRSSPIDEKAAQKKKAREEEKVKAMEERRVVYVGKIPETYTKRQLYQRFQCFGEIKEVKLNFREHGDNYGFVTFAYACDAIAAKEKGNNIEGVPKFDLCFGGRRRFCPDQYADLDGNREIEEEYAPMPKSMAEELDYAALLRQHTTQQRKGGRL
ncbi:peroxisome proliferator-activated receptor gamma coactivator-related protein 1 [Plakobranchus ocellatus]|uniref:Peroxisome proliferator-activated receptor gamma coactivator-related protein 1 n=1 Tax=Plakobranchus ocellatus TaxID=259542 RepID=A0AAV4C0R6_9GAST|nr:peroxisome proliferator-activated receptor gamma coactivator-related protein 1 [Plakobranchus ocellatus]